MKIIEALKKVKSNRIKAMELSSRIRTVAAHMESAKDSLPYKNPEAKVKEWLQAIRDIENDNATLLARIQNTNLQTRVGVEMPNGKVVEKTISEWIYRRREGIASEQTAYEGLSVGRLVQRAEKDSQGNIVIDNVVRNYDQEQRDTRLSHLREEVSLIDSALEIVNATTDLL